MKSKKIGDNDSRRIKLLTDLAALDFNIYLLVVDKAALFGEGLRHKKSFYKFINGLLYNDLYRLYPDLQLFTDEHGTLDYMDGFAKYVNKKHIPGLFEGSTFQFLQSQSTRLIPFEKSSGFEILTITFLERFFCPLVRARPMCLAPFVAFIMMSPKTAASA